MIPQYMKEKRFSAYYKLLTVGILLLGLLPELVAVALTALLFLFYLVHNYIQKNRITADLTGMLLIFFDLFLFITVIWSEIETNTLYSFVMWMCGIALFIIIFNLCDTKTKIENVLLCFVGSAMLSSVVAIIQMSFMAVGKPELVPSPLYENLSSWFSHIVMYPLFLEDAHDRVSSTFMTPLALSTFLVTAFPIAIFLGFYGKTKKRRGFAILSALLIFFGILFTFLKGTVFAVIVSLMLLSFAGKKPAKLMSAVAAVSSMTMLLVIYFRRGVTTAQDISTNSRLDLWKSCLNAFVAHPFGLGAGSDNVRRILFKDGLFFANAHNLFIEILTETGVIGTLLFAVIMITVIKNIFELYDIRGWYKRYAIALASSLIGFFAMSVFESTLSFPKEVIFFSVILGLISSVRNIARKKGKLPQKGKERVITVYE
ncbi:MAG: O-antigen ligase family protein [Ruminococcaceae bacterium]|nr:O-antigen ligase family protein [Oscillospiraceae bacterium]